MTAASREQSKKEEEVLEGALWPSLLSWSIGVVLALVIYQQTATVLLYPESWCPPASPFLLPNESDGCAYKNPNAFSLEVVRGWLTFRWLWADGNENWIALKVGGRLVWYGAMSISCTLGPLYFYTAWKCVYLEDVHKIRFLFVAFSPEEARETGGPARQVYAHICERIERQILLLLGTLKSSSVFAVSVELFVLLFLFLFSTLFFESVCGLFDVLSVRRNPFGFVFWVLTAFTVELRRQQWHLVGLAGMCIGHLSVVLLGNLLVLWGAVPFRQSRRMSDASVIPAELCEGLCLFVSSKDGRLLLVPESELSWWQKATWLLPPQTEERLGNHVIGRREETEVDSAMSAVPPNNNTTEKEKEEGAEANEGDGEQAAPAPSPPPAAPPLPLLPRCRTVPDFRPPLGRRLHLSEGGDLPSTYLFSNKQLRAPELFQISVRSETFDSLLPSLRALFSSGSSMGGGKKGNLRGGRAGQPGSALSSFQQLDSREKAKDAGRALMSNGRARNLEIALKKVGMHPLELSELLANLRGEGGNERADGVGVEGRGDGEREGGVTKACGHSSKRAETYSVDPCTDGADSVADIPNNSSCLSGMNGIAVQPSVSSLPLCTIVEVEEEGEGEGKLSTRRERERTERGSERGGSKRGGLCPEGGRERETDRDETPTGRPPRMTPHLLIGDIPASSSSPSPSSSALSSSRGETGGDGTFLLIPPESASAMRAAAELLLPVLPSEEELDAMYLHLTNLHKSLMKKGGRPRGVVSSPSCAVQQQQKEKAELGSSCSPFELYGETNALGEKGLRESALVPSAETGRDRANLKGDVFCARLETGGESGSVGELGADLEAEEEGEGLLRAPEKTILPLALVKRSTERLRIVGFSLSFRAKLENPSALLSKIRQAAIALLQSPRFQRLLSHATATVNFVNGYTDLPHFAHTPPSPVPLSRTPTEGGLLKGVHLHSNRPSALPKPKAKPKPKPKQHMPSGALTARETCTHTQQQQQQLSARPKIPLKAKMRLHPPPSSASLPPASRALSPSPAPGPPPSRSSSPGAPVAGPRGQAEQERAEAEEEAKKERPARLRLLRVRDILLMSDFRSSVLRPLSLLGWLIAILECQQLKEGENEREEGRLSPCRIKRNDMPAAEGGVVELGSAPEHPQQPSLPSGASCRSSSSSFLSLLQEDLLPLGEVATLLHGDSSNSNSYASSAGAGGGGVGEGGGCIWGGSCGVSVSDVLASALGEFDKEASFLKGEIENNAAKYVEETGPRSMDLSLLEAFVWKYGEELRPDVLTRAERLLSFGDRSTDQQASPVSPHAPSEAEIPSQSFCQKSRLGGSLTDSRAHCVQLRSEPSSSSVHGGVEGAGSEVIESEEKKGEWIFRERREGGKEEPEEDVERDEATQMQSHIPLKKKTAYERSSVGMLSCDSPPSSLVFAGVGETARLGSKSQGMIVQTGEEAERKGGLSTESPPTQKSPQARVTVCIEESEEGRVGREWQKRGVKQFPCTPTQQSSLSPLLHLPPLSSERRPRPKRLTALDSLRRFHLCVSRERQRLANQRAETVEVCKRVLDSLGIPSRQTTDALCLDTAVDVLLKAWALAGKAAEEWTEMGRLGGLKALTSLHGPSGVALSGGIPTGAQTHRPSSSVGGQRQQQLGPLASSPGGKSAGGGKPTAHNVLCGSTPNRSIGTQPSRLPRPSTPVQSPSSIRTPRHHPCQFSKQSDTSAPAQSPSSLRTPARSPGGPVGGRECTRTPDRTSVSRITPVRSPLSSRRREREVLEGKRLVVASSGTPQLRGVVLSPQLSVRSETSRRSWERERDGAGSWRRGRERRQQVEGDMESHEHLRNRHRDPSHTDPHRLSGACSTPDMHMHREKEKTTQPPPRRSSQTALPWRPPGPCSSILTPVRSLQLNRPTSCLSTSSLDYPRTSEGLGRPGRLLKGGQGHLDATLIPHSAEADKGLLEEKRSITSTFTPRRSPPPAPPSCTPAGAPSSRARSSSRLQPASRPSNSLSLLPQPQPEEVPFASLTGSRRSFLSLRHSVSPPESPVLGESKRGLEMGTMAEAGAEKEDNEQALCFSTPVPMRRKHQEEEKGGETKEEPPSPISGPQGPFPPDVAKEPTSPSASPAAVFPSNSSGHFAAAAADVKDRGEQEDRTNRFPGPPLPPSQLTGRSADRENSPYSSASSNVSVSICTAAHLEKLGCAVEKGRRLRKEKEKKSPPALSPVSGVSGPASAASLSPPGRFMEVPPLSLHASGGVGEEDEGGGMRSAASYPSAKTSSLLYRPPGGRGGGSGDTDLRWQEHGMAGDIEGGGAYISHSSASGVFESSSLLPRRNRVSGRNGLGGPSRCRLRSRPRPAVPQTPQQGAGLSSSSSGFSSQHQQQQQIQGTNAGGLSSSVSFSSSHSKGGPLLWVKPRLLISSSAVTKAGEGEGAGGRLETRYEKKREKEKGESLLKKPLAVPRLPLHRLTGGTGGEATPRRKQEHGGDRRKTGRERSPAGSPPSSGTRLGGGDLPSPSAWGQGGPRSGDVR
uniref:Uncharacterized protein n=1 Tax=Chromera velia CCMP2878 TaxID=1169474 RepID=A0A0G4G3G1_9ALVE|eukprot:Cvel_4132.t1-p1 / transcript=Cvel_4132.t1 / gene=Cvel_4132 / organism=Chromera_velia_CCMP2878 / gene_product=hypothetical protein / transcript_product=hypothetical protein / location=Cvel_scaffold177:6385-15331(+) / protein_length=2512 / sequence_SO=supercontig / SO=protein_coding / is_pseudo=false